MRNCWISNRLIFGKRINDGREVDQVWFQGDMYHMWFMLSLNMCNVEQVNIVQQIYKNNVRKMDR